MTLLGCVDYLTVDMRGVLPRSPYLIVSNMALFAGSDLCRMNIGSADSDEVTRLLRDERSSLGW